MYVEVQPKETIGLWGAPQAARKSSCSASIMAMNAQLNTSTQLIEVCNALDFIPKSFFTYLQ